MPGAPGRYESDRVIGLEAHHGRGVGGYQPACLLGHGREQLVLRNSAGDQGRHPAQRYLLLGDHGGLGADGHPHRVRAVGRLGHVVAADRHDVPVTHLVDLTHRALWARVAPRRIGGHELGLADDRVVGGRNDTLGADKEPGELAHTGDPVPDRSVHTAERHAIYQQLDVLVEQLTPDVEVALVERPAIAGDKRFEICAHELSLRPPFVEHRRNTPQSTLRPPDDNALRLPRVLAEEDCRFQLAAMR